MSVATALQTTDILCAISEQLSVERYNRRFRGKRRADLARLARVCTAFVDPALRVLWRMLPGAGPLLRLLSCVDVVRHEHYTEFVLGRAVVAEEWERFHHYARYVQVIDQHDNIRPDCEPEPYRGELIEHVLQQAILLSNGGKPFFTSHAQAVVGVHRHLWPFGLASQGHYHTELSVATIPDRSIYPAFGAALQLF
ncbi:uncharacterized protein B0H18DRAFT_1119687 [Fomitopsis serialis]|uniref:uncharacterized protein n=1 Tax=Fomitopsis serialis TaxID=139415 RepID=UPI002007DFF8|nr:uncharacterized protein B0H18DRAFT_1119687 [Neoantrodia serialis]KAH9924900.1 hypothetical protein B0H18DRAFT_1119687 [Neoantrodia serialis]